MFYTPYNKLTNTDRYVHIYSTELLPAKILRTQDIFPFRNLNKGLFIHTPLYRSSWFLNMQLTMLKLILK